MRIKNNSIKHLTTTQEFHIALFSMKNIIRVISHDK